MEICYLIAFPDADDGKALTPEPFKGLKDAPYFQPIDIDLVTLGEETVLIEGHAVQVFRQRYDGRVQMVECRFVLKDPFAASVLQERAKIEQALQSKFIPTPYRQSGLYEEYTILLAQDANPSPDKWIEKNALALTKFIRSQREVFDKSEVEEILTSRTHYSARELTLVDWEGAVIIAPNEDYQSDIALLKIGNYQLLRYRMLDQSIDAMLDKISETFFENKRRPYATRGVIRQIAEHKLEVMLDFERAEQNLLLIGDWYTAKLYEAIQSEFYLKDWKENLKNKLDNLETIVETIKDNFSTSFESLMDRLQLIGWVVLLVGYIYLFFLDAGWIKFP
jgi:predicted GIY-YIG superfamily endonuclease